MTKIHFWKDGEKETVDPRLFSDLAEKLAQEIGADHDQIWKKPNKPAQIRKFYDEVLRLSQVAHARPDQWEYILPQVHMVTAKAAYSGGRELISPNFLEFIRESIAQVHRPKDLWVFANFFEAFMGFYKLHGPKN